MLDAIDVSTLRQQKGIKTPVGGTSFTEIMSAMGPATAESMGQASGPFAASMTHAAITGAGEAAAPAGAGAYGMAGMTSPFSSGGYSVPETVGYGSGGTVGGSYQPGSYGGADLGGSSGLPTDPFLQQDYLLNKMRETNMQMITIQAEVQNINRDWTTRSNLLKAKHDTNMALVRNFRVA